MQALDLRGDVREGDALMEGHPFRDRPETIWKYPLEAPFVARTHQIPREAEIVHVGADPGGEGVALWCRVQNDQARVTRRFVYIGTADDFPENARYVGSAIVDPYAWHVFELP